MENLSHSHSFLRNHSLSRHESRLFPNKIYSNNVFSKQTKVYDDVFGAPPRFGVPPTSFSPRAEDYAEIFGCFSASRASPSSAAAASSIPVLDLPVADTSEVEFDSRAHTLEYDDIFGGFSGLDFALSYEELFEPFKGGEGGGDHGNDDGYADQAWTPAESEYQSEESDPLTDTASNNLTSNEDPVKLFDNDTRFISSDYQKNSSDEDMSNENVKVVNHLHSVSGITVVVDESSPLQKTKVKKPPLNVADDISVCMDLNGEMMEGCHFRKTKSFPSNKSSGQQTFGNNSKPQRVYNYDGVHPNGTLLSVSEVSLSTCPSHVPPPSRQPPSVLDSKMRDSTRFSSSHEASTNAAHEGTLSSPLFFKGEVDASSSAAAMKEVMNKAQEKLRNAKELMERKKEVNRNHTMLGLRNNIDHMDGRVVRMVGGSIDEEVQRTHAIVNDEMNVQKPMKTEELVPHLTEEEKQSNAAKLSSKKEHCEDSKVCCGTDRTGECNEVAEFYEIVQTDLSSKSFGQSNNDKFLMKNFKVCKYGQKEAKTVLETVEWQEENDEKVVRDAVECEENKNSQKFCKVAYEGKKNEGISKTAKIIYSQVDPMETVKDDDEKNEEDKKSTLFWEHDNFRNTIVGYKEWEEYGNLMKVPTKVIGVEVKDAVTNKHNSEQMQEATNRIENEDNLKVVCESKQVEQRLGKTLKWEENEERLDKAFEQAEYDERLKEALEKQQNKDRIKQAPWCAENEMKEKVSCQRGNENKPCYSLKQDKNEKEKLHDEIFFKKVKEAFELDENEKSLNEVVTQKENEKKRKHAHRKQDSEERLTKYFGQVQNEERLNRAQKQQENEDKEDTEEREVNKMLHKGFSEQENTENRIKEAYKNKRFQKKPKEAQERGENESEEAQEAATNEMRPLKANVQVEDKLKQPDQSETEKRVKYSGELTKLMALRTSDDLTKMAETECKVRLARENCAHMEGNNLKATDEAYELEYGKNLQATLVAYKHEGNSGKTGAAFANLETGKIMVETDKGRKGLGAIEMAKLLSDEKLGTAGTAQVLFEHTDKPFRVKDARESFPSDNGNKSSIEAGIDSGQAKNWENQIELPTIADFENLEKKLSPDWEGRRKNSNGIHVINDVEKNKDHVMSNQPMKEQVEMGRGMEAISLLMSQRKGNNQKIDQQFSTSQLRKRTEKNETQISEDRGKEECRRRELELERDRLRKIEEEREREREREKDRMAVKISTCVVRDHAYTEAHERAAVEKTNSEARQRVLAEARERLEKACAEAREKSLADKVSMETKLKVERLAVERAIAEARERVVDRAMAGKAVYDSRESIERYVAKRYSSCRDDGKTESSYSEMHNIGYSYSLGHPNSSVYPGAESPQRCKARLERHQRMDERMAKALAEKNMRDLLAQREQAERNRLAENLDAEVRRWSSGKEGNLRALLSTLQYILGNDSGWQPIPLTDVITAVAVKKAYRKATLCVHPDKLQQRGASIQQKYICEKIFDLLKEAWRQFNSEER